MHRLLRRALAAHQKGGTHKDPPGFSTSAFSRRGLCLPSATSTLALLLRFPLLVWRKEAASTRSLTTYNLAVASSDLRAQSWSLPRSSLCRFPSRSCSYRLPWAQDPLLPLPSCSLSSTWAPSSLRVWAPTCPAYYVHLHRPPPSWLFLPSQSGVTRGGVGPCLPWCRS